MDYNTSRQKMVLPEYGRNVQKMVDQMNAIEDRQERSECAHAIVQLMGTMFPGLNVPEYKQKLWDHLTIMSNFNLDIDTDFTLPTKESLEQKPDIIPYPSNRIKVRHYGKAVEKMIDFVVTIEDEEERRYTAKQIANQMKKDFLTFNKDVVTDVKILDDLNRLSKGQLNYTENDIRLSDTKPPQRPQKKRRTPNRKN